MNRVKKIAERRIDRELDITVFLRKQLILNQILPDLIRHFNAEKKIHKKLVIDPYGE